MVLIQFCDPEQRDLTGRGPRYWFTDTADAAGGCAEERKTTVVEIIAFDVGLGDWSDFCPYTTTVGLVIRRRRYNILVHIYFFFSLQTSR